ncbi:MAG: hypothetical protein GY749_02825 [Desulfobacteraceae bacterium]|nr:hypothetical protein [Desulfobacteraceae bacterium]
MIELIQQIRATEKELAETVFRLDSFDIESLTPEGALMLEVVRKVFRTMEEAFEKADSEVAEFEDSLSIVGWDDDMNPLWERQEG